jgi:hypothetical protein
MAARLASGMPPGLGPVARARRYSHTLGGGGEGTGCSGEEEGRDGGGARGGDERGTRGRDGSDGQAGLPPRPGGGELVWTAGGAGGGGAGRPGGCARAGAARRAVADADGPTTRARAHQGGHPGTRASEALSEEEAASARCERRGRREAGKQEAAEREADHCADMNGVPLTRTPPRRSRGRGPSPWGWRRIQARRSTCLLLLAMQRRRVESLVLEGRFHHRQYTVLLRVLCWCWGPQHSGIVRLFEVV